MAASWQARGTVPQGHHHVGKAGAGPLFDAPQAEVQEGASAGLDRFEPGQGPRLEGEGPLEGVQGLKRELDDPRFGRELFEIGKRRRGSGL